jgi:hypothetical protein
MDQNDKDYLNLLGETMALQVIITQLARQMAGQDRSCVSMGFNMSANFIENFSFNVGRQGSADQLGHALRVVEEMRTAALSDQ